MPPRQTKRLKTSATAKANTFESNSTAKGKNNASMDVQPSNGKCKFIELPLELLLEIMSYFPAVHIPTSRQFNTPVLPPSIFERWDVLRALSQTCRLWRAIFYPMLWERMEACAIREELPRPRFCKPMVTSSEVELDMTNFRGETIPVTWYKGVSRLLEKISKGLIADPTAAHCVRTVNVSLTRCSPETVLPAFVQCLEQLPNLQTVQILRAHTQMAKMLQDYFEEHSFPTVQTLIVPEHGHPILRCCPEVRKVICNYGDGSKLITAIAKRCKKVEILEGIEADKNFLKRIVRACPNLRELKLTGEIEKDPAVLSVLSVLENLTRIEVQVGKNYGDSYLRDPRIAQVVKVAKIALGNRTEGKKVLRLWYQFSSRFSAVQRWSVEIPL